MSTSSIHHRCAVDYLTHSQKHPYYDAIKRWRQLFDQASVTVPTLEEILAMSLPSEKLLSHCEPVLVPAYENGEEAFSILDRIHRLLFDGRAIDCSDSVDRDTAFGSNNRFLLLFRMRRTYFRRCHAFPLKLVNELELLGTFGAVWSAMDLGAYGANKDDRLHGFTSAGNTSESFAMPYVVNRRSVLYIRSLPMDGEPIAMKNLIIQDTADRDSIAPCYPKRIPSRAFVK